VLWAMLAACASEQPPAQRVTSPENLPSDSQARGF
jgi:hypothetical protein